VYQYPTTEAGYYVPAGGYFPATRQPGGGLSAYLPPEAGQFVPSPSVSDPSAWADFFGVFTGAAADEKKKAQAEAEAEKAKLAQLQLQAGMGTQFPTGTAGTGMGWLGRSAIGGIPNWLLLAAGGFGAWFLLRR
jgi:hypothetical protein